MADDNSNNPPSPLDAFTRINHEQGRWVVYLNVPHWAKEHTEPASEETDAFAVVNRWQRLNDYSTEQEAVVAAQWIERSANRSIRPPSGF